MPEHNPVVKLNPQSLRSSINAKCAQCMGCERDHLEPGFREQIRNCTDKSCALYELRPYQKVKHRR